MSLAETTLPSAVSRVFLKSPWQVVSDETFRDLPYHRSQHYRVVASHISWSIHFLRKGTTYIECQDCGHQLESQLMLWMDKRTDDLFVDMCLRRSGAMQSGPAALPALSCESAC